MKMVNLKCNHLWNAKMEIGSKKMTLFYIWISKKEAYFVVRGMHVFCQSLVSYPIELGSLPGFLQTERERVGVFFAFWSGFVFCECFLGCVYLCLLECKKKGDWKKCFFRSRGADIFTNCLAVRAFWPLSKWITHFECISSMWIFPLFVYECVCVLLLFVCSTDEIASPPRLLRPPPPPPPNVISLPLGPWQTHQTGRK